MSSAADASARTSTDRIYSPDDGGWYAQETNLSVGNSRVTKRVYASEASLKRALENPKNIWMAWSRPAALATGASS